MRALAQGAATRRYRRLSQGYLQRNEGVTPVAAPTVVLVVEDESILRCAVAQALRDAGFDVVERGTADEAVTYAGGGGRVDVVFTDIQLPGRLNGWDVAEHFRAVRPEVRIIYTSGNSVDRSRRVANSLFFDKPYDPTAVARACVQRP
jgi:CheY-like chemotaxis protein